MSAVGFHRERAEPGSALAKARMQAHTAFDTIWQSGWMSRSEAYRWLADQLGVEPKDCHMVLFGEATCKRVTALADAYTFKRMLDL